MTVSNQRNQAFAIKKLQSGYRNQVINNCKQGIQWDIGCYLSDSLEQGISLVVCNLQLVQNGRVVDSLFEAIVTCLVWLRAESG